MIINFLDPDDSTENVFIQKNGISLMTKAMVNVMKTQQ